MVHGKREVSIRLISFSLSVGENSFSCRTIAPDKSFLMVGAPRESVVCRENARGLKANFPFPGIWPYFKLQNRVKLGWKKISVHGASPVSASNANSRGSSRLLADDARSNISFHALPHLLDDSWCAKGFWCGVVIRRPVERKADRAGHPERFSY